MAEPAAGYNPTFPVTNEMPPTSVIVDPARTPKPVAEPRFTVNWAVTTWGKIHIPAAMIENKVPRPPRFGFGWAASVESEAFMVFIGGK